jgi:hypothetical protein
VGAHLTFGNKMKIIRKFALLATGASILLFVVNIIGKNIFLYLAISDQTLVVAASQGVCHMALTTEDTTENPMDDSTPGILMPDIGYQDLLRLGPLILFMENRLDPVSPLRFGFTRGDESYDYSSVEFPWLLIPCLLFGVSLITKPTKKAESGPRD